MKFSRIEMSSVAFILRECKVILQRARELIPEHRQVLEALPSRLSQADALSQLLQSLDEATSHPTEEDLGELFSELRADALGTLMGWLPKLHNERVRALVQTAAERLAQAYAPEVLKALASTDPAVQLEMVRLAGRLKLPGAPDGMGPRRAHHRGQVPGATRPSQRVSPDRSRGHGHKTERRRPD